MAIVVPRAGLTAGRSASVQVATPDTGSAIAQFGGVMKQVGDGLLAEQADRELSRAKMTMMQGLQDLRMKWEQTGDPDAIDREFPAEAKAMREQLVAGLMPRNQHDGGLLFDQLAFSHSSALGGKAIDLRQSQKRANLDEMGRIAIGAATTDPETASAYLGQARTELDKLVKDGTLTAEMADAKWQEISGGSESARMERLMSDSPAALVTAIDDGQLGGALDGETREKWRSRAVAKAEADAAALAQAEKVATSEKIGAARDLVKDGIGVFRTGSDFKSEAQIEELRKDPAMAAALAPELAELDNAKALYTAMPGFATLSLEGKKKARAEAAAKPKDKAYQADVVKAMDSSIAEHEAAARDGNLYAYAESVGVKKIEPLPDPTDPNADIASAMKKRAWTAQGLAASGMTGTDARGKAKDAPFFDPAEREAYAALVAPDAPPKEKARLAAALSVLGPNADRVARELGADPVMDWITGGIGNAALDEKLALEAFEGQRADVQKQVALPPISERRGTFWRELPSLFGDGTSEGPDENSTMQAVLATTDAIYAHRTKGKAVAGEAAVMDEELYSQIIFEVMGGKGTYGSSDARGGLAKVTTGGEEYPLILPRGIAGDQVETAFEGMTARLTQSQSTFGIFPKIGSSGAPMDDKAWAAMSHSGRPPRIGGKPMDAKTFSSARLRPAGGDLYELEVLDRATGRYVPIGDDQSKPWFFRMSDFVKAGGAE